MLLGGLRDARFALSLAAEKEKTAGKEGTRASASCAVLSARPSEVIRAVRSSMI
jgi:hypothetical protein